MLFHKFDRCVILRIAIHDILFPAPGHGPEVVYTVQPETLFNQCQPEGVLQPGSQF